MKLNKPFVTWNSSSTSLPFVTCKVHMDRCIGWPTNQKPNCIIRQGNPPTQFFLCIYKKLNMYRIYSLQSLQSTKKKEKTTGVGYPSKYSNAPWCNAWLWWTIVQALFESLFTTKNITSFIYKMTPFLDIQIIQ